MPTQPGRPASRPTHAPVARGAGRSRQLKPEVAARLLEQRLRELYRKPVEELSESELLLMRAAFFRGA